MTLTRILPTLRRSIPDPIAGDHWPAATVATITDVTVDGVSLLRVVESSGCLEHPHHDDARVLRP